MLITRLGSGIRACRARYRSSRVVARVAIISTFPLPGAIQAGRMAGSTLTTGTFNSWRMASMQLAVAVLQATRMALQPMSTSL